MVLCWSFTGCGEIRRLADRAGFRDYPIVYVWPHANAPREDQRAAFAPVPRMLVKLYWPQMWPRQWTIPDVTCCRLRPREGSEAPPARVREVVFCLSDARNGQVFSGFC